MSFACRRNSACLLGFRAFVRKVCATLMAARDGHNGNEPGSGRKIGRGANQDQSRPDVFAQRTVTSDSDSAARSRLLKRVLPITTGILVVVMLAWPLLSKRADNVSLSFKEIARRGEQVRVVGAHYMGTDVLNRPFEISAETAVQDGVDAEEANLTGIKASIEISPDETVTVTGGEGIYARRKDHLSLTRGIVFSTDSGYRIDSEKADIDLAAGVATSKSAVKGAASFGSFSANGFTLDAKKQSLVLDGGVKVRLEPGKDSDRAAGVGAVDPATEPAAE